MSIVKKFAVILALIIFSATTSVEAEENNSSFDVLASVESSNAVFGLIKAKSNGFLSFLIISKEDKSVAFVQYSRKVYDFYLKKDESGYSPLMFLLLIPEQERGQVDDNLGEWKDKLHAIPVYALFDVTDDGKIVSTAPNFYSGEGTVQPSHYHSDIKNPVHTRLIEILMQAMPALHKQIQDKGVVLPD